MTTFLQEKMQKNAKNFFCKNCDFTTSNRYNYEKHLSTAKHKNTTKYNENTTFLQENARPEKQFVCVCGKKYPYRSSLHNHKKRCTYKGDQNKIITEKKVIDMSIVDTSFTKIVINLPIVRSVSPL